MAVATIDRLNTGQVTRQEAKLLKFFAPLTETVIWLYGKADAGKTITAVSVSHSLREFYGKMPILDFHPRDAYGPYEYMGPRELVTALEKIGDMIDSGALIDTMDEETIGGILEKELGIHLLNATIVLDEAYRVLRKRHSGKRLILVHEDLLQIYKHYHLTIIMCSPGHDIGFRAVDQVILPMVCSFDPRTMRVLARGRDRNTLERVSIITPVSKYGPMYNRWNPVAVLRGRKIEVKGL